MRCTEFYTKFKENYVMATQVQLNYFKRFMGLLVVMTVALQSIACFGADTEQNAVNPTENKAAYSGPIRKWLNV